MAKHPFLRPREATTLRDAHYAIRLVPNRHYLTPGGSIQSAERLIEMGLLTRISDKKAGLSRLDRPSRNGFGIIVKMTDANIDRYNQMVACWWVGEAIRGSK